MALLIGYDIGSSAIKAALLDADTGKLIASCASPATELAIDSAAPGWAEQPPSLWWEHVKIATAQIRDSIRFDADDVKAIGISYQMHGLVLVDEAHRVLRPSIIWCDSRAVDIGREAADALGRTRCLERLLNLPGNFTASRLKWVMDNEPAVYARLHKAMLPGDYIAMKMTGEIATTPSGLSEGILWDFEDQGMARVVLDHYAIGEDKLPGVVPTFSVQGELTPRAAEELGLSRRTVVAYRAGDQPNNALALNVLQPGEVAATAGTSGVVYAVSAVRAFDRDSRVNTFVHVNHSDDDARYGVLLCMNGTGSLNRWINKTLARGMSYDAMNDLAAGAPVGSAGLVILPYGNGAERTLGNQDPGACIGGVDFNRHGLGHLFRAAQEGIVFALDHGLQIVRDMGIEVHTVRAGRANMFLSQLFQSAFATVTGTRVELFNTDGAQGAARGAGIGCGIYGDTTEAFEGLEAAAVIEPDHSATASYNEARARWSDALHNLTA